MPRKGIKDSLCPPSRLCPFSLATLRFNARRFFSASSFSSSSRSFPCHVTSVPPPKKGRSLTAPFFPLAQAFSLCGHHAPQMKKLIPGFSSDQVEAFSISARSSSRCDGPVLFAAYGFFYTPLVLVKISAPFNEVI